LIFSRPIFLEVLKERFKLWWYEFGNGKKCELQHHLNVLRKKKNQIWILKMDFELHILFQCSVLLPKCSK
jgi:hypothetical protein